MTKYRELLAGRQGAQMESEMPIHRRCEPSLWHSVYCTCLALERLLLKSGYHHGASAACHTQIFTALAFERLLPISKYCQALIQRASPACETQTFSVFAFHLRNHCPYQATDKVSRAISRTGKSEMPIHRLCDTWIPASLHLHLFWHQLHPILVTESWKFINLKVNLWNQTIHSP